MKKAHIIEMFLFAGFAGFMALGLMELASVFADSVMFFAPIIACIILLLFGSVCFVFFEILGGGKDKEG